MAAALKGRMDAPEPLASDVLPRGVRSRFVDNGNGLRMHLLEAGHDEGDRPCVLLRCPLTT